jgi:acyl-CoA synthetase (NDP forming)
VLLIKVGRHPVGAGGALAHRRAGRRSDDVFDAALRRAGVVRLYNVDADVRRGDQCAVLALPAAWQPPGDPHQWRRPGA